MPANAWAAEGDLDAVVQNVRAATAYRYGATDSLGNKLDGLKVVDDPRGGYLGVYETRVGTTPYTRLATSTDLGTWKAVAILASHAAHPTIAPMGTGFVVAYEQDVMCAGAGAPAGTCLRFLHYPDATALLGRRPDRSFQAKRTLSRCAEGTPSIYTARLAPDLAHSTVKVGFHYSRDCKIDRQADGTLTNFGTWTKGVPQRPNAEVQAAGAWGNMTDRDSIDYGPVREQVLEGQLTLGDSSSWRVFRWDGVYGATLLDVRTHGGSTTFRRPSATWVKAPGGGRAIVVTMSVEPAGAAPGEAGELVFYKAIPPDALIATAGDIACDPTTAGFNGGLGTSSSCRSRYTSDILATTALDGVLPLGDNQYENGALSNYLGSYDTSWGRVKGITRPVPGNHEYGTAGAAGYYTYFNGAGVTGPAGPTGKGYYSYDIGTWHLIALNSNCTAAGGCRAGSPQEVWLKADLAAHPASCVLAYWHHPRFSSGNHGDNASAQPFWDALYAAGADLVLAGHDHDYERFAPQTPTGAPDPVNGIREFVVGTGGRSHYSFGVPKPNSEVRNSTTFGVLELALRPGSYTWAFAPEAGKAFTDAGSAPCH